MSLISRPSFRKKVPKIRSETREISLYARNRMKNYHYGKEKSSDNERKNERIDLLSTVTHEGICLLVTDIRGSGYPVLFQFTVERPFTDTEYLSCLAAVTVCMIERIDNGLPLNLFQRGFCLGVNWHDFNHT